MCTTGGQHVINLDRLRKSLCPEGLHELAKFCRHGIAVGKTCCVLATSVGIAPCRLNARLSSPRLSEMVSAWPQDPERSHSHVFYTNCFGLPGATPAASIAYGGLRFVVWVARCPTTNKTTVRRPRKGGEESGSPATFAMVVIFKHCLLAGARCQAPLKRFMQQTFPQCQIPRHTDEVDNA